MPNSEQLVFYKSKTSEKWWMQVGSIHKGEEDMPIDRHLIIPCSYSDYEQACKGELPERWIKAQSKPV